MFYLILNRLWNVEIDLLHKRQYLVLFCKYLRNKSSDLYEILCSGQLLSCELMFEISCELAIKRVVKIRLEFSVYLDLERCM